MNKKNSLALLTFVCLIFINAGCTKTSPEKPFSQFGVSFTCPSGWEIDEASEMAPGYYISIEKTGMNSSGIVSIMIAEEEIDLNVYLSAFQEGISSQSLYSQLNMSETVEGKCGEYPGICAHYTASIMKLPHEGRMYAFSTNGKTIYVLEQEATEDKKENAAGFKTIRESLTIE